MSEEVKANIDAAIKFLQMFLPDGPWMLTAIRRDKKSIKGGSFDPTKEKEARKWLHNYSKDDNWNIYFHVNSIEGEVKTKAEKVNIKSAGWLYVDIDAREGVSVDEELDRILGLLTSNLPKSIPEPTVITYSGGGYQAFWKLDKPFIIDGQEENWEKYEAYNKRLEQVFEGDHCHNVERIMRLPGTVNNPDDKKKAKGRVQALSKILQFNKNQYDVELKFKPASQTQTGGGVIKDAAIRSNVDIDMSRSEEVIVDLSELDEWEIPERLKLIVAQGKHPTELKKGDNSRSAWVFDCVCNLLRKGVPDGIIYSLLTDKEWGISESVLEQRDPSRYAIKQIATAKEYVIDPHLAMMNNKFAVIGNVGGKCKVVEEVPDELMGRSRITFSSFEDIRNRYSNKKVQIGTDKDGKPIFIPLGKYWLGHENRAQYDFIKFMPSGAPRNIFNLWRGFAVNAHPGDCSLYLDHVKNNICGGNEVYYDYMIRWMARAIQKPDSQGEVAVVLRGGKGTGKSFFATEFGKVYGRHFLHVANSSHLVGNFNAHLKDTILLFADEAFFAGDRKHESVLKMLVTEETIPIEQKHVDVEPYPNYIHLIMAANDPHVVRATGDERRYFVLEVSTSKQQDSDYFGAIVEQQENGGREALLFYLQNLDLDGFQVRNVPQTEALLEQKMLSLDPMEEWWFRKLQDGRLRESEGEWKTAVLCSVLEQDFIKHGEDWKITRRGNQTQLGRFLNRVAPHMERKQITATVEEPGRDGYPTRVRKRVYAYHFGTLDQCRDAWERLNGKVTWSEYQPNLDEEVEEPF